MPGIPCPPCTRSHGSGGAPAHLGSGLAHGSMQSDAGGGGGGGGPGGSALAVSATIRPSPESRANTAATMRVLMVPPRSRFRPARCRSRPGSSRGRTRRSWRRCRARCGNAVGMWEPRRAPRRLRSPAALSARSAVAAMARASDYGEVGVYSHSLTPGRRRAVCAGRPHHPFLCPARRWSHGAPNQVTSAARSDSRSA